MPTNQELVGAQVRELRKARGWTLQKRAGKRKAFGAGFPKPHFKTARGAAYCGKAEGLLPALPDESVNLIFTSPPYALHFKKDGGNWRPGHPVRALCHFEVLIRLVREHGFHLAQEFFWHNPAKLPAPAEWVTVRRIRVKDSVEALWWLSKSTQPKADNRQVLTEYSADMKRLLKRGYRAKERPSGHKITNKFTEQGGAIPPNLLTLGNNDANGYYLTRCAEESIKPHPARFPVQLPEFFIKFLTESGDLVLDPFAGSGTLFIAAERTGRRGRGIEIDGHYVDTAIARWERYTGRKAQTAQGQTFAQMKLERKGQP